MNYICDSTVSGLKADYTRNHLERDTQQQYSGNGETGKPIKSGQRNSGTIAV